MSHASRLSKWKFSHHYTATLALFSSDNCKRFTDNLGCGGCRSCLSNFQAFHLAKWIFFEAWTLLVALLLFVSKLALLQMSLCTSMWCKRCNWQHGSTVLFLRVLVIVPEIEWLEDWYVVSISFLFLFLFNATWEVRLVVVLINVCTGSVYVCSGSSLLQGDKASSASETRSKACKSGSSRGCLTRCNKDGSFWQWYQYGTHTPASHFLMTGSISLATKFPSRSE